MPIIKGQFVNKNQLSAGGGTTSKATDVDSAIDSSAEVPELNRVFAALIAANPKQVTALNAIYEKLKPKEKTADEVKKEGAKTEADKIITLLEDEYFKNKLAKGNNLQGILAEINAGIGLNPNDPYVVWKNLLESRRPQLAKAAGDTGNIAWQEQLQSSKPFPSSRSDYKTAVKRFQQLRKGFDLPERDYSTTGNYAPSGLESLGKQYGL